MEVDRKVNDVVVKIKEENGKMEVINLRMFINGYTGQHITAVDGQEPFCDCTAFRTRKKCIHAAVAKILIYSFNQIIPTLEIEKVFDKAINQT